MSTDTKPKVLITSSEYPQIGYDILDKKCEILQCKLNGFGDKDQTREEIESLIVGVDAIIWSTKVHLGKELLDKAGNQLKVVAAMSAGVDHIDKAELKTRGILLGNTPDVLNSAVADMAIMLMIAASRRLTEGIRNVHSGKWQLGPQSMLGRDIKNSTVGIIGYGGVGKTISKRLSGFEVNKILYTGRKKQEEVKATEAEYVTFDELLVQSDIVFLSCSLNESTQKLMNAAAFSKMKSTAVFVNVSRGEVVDQEALINTLKNKKIFAAGLDVMTPEPLPADNPLIALSNCFIAPHMGSATVQTRNDMAQLSALNALLGLQGEPMLTPVL